MIAVEIPAALATDPQVVPVDAGPARDYLVGERVALAWREPTGMKDCGSTGPQFCNLGRCDCPSIDRMVVGWTAEVEAVVPIGISPGCGFRGDQPHLCVRDGTRLILFHETHRRVDYDHLRPLADWSPGRYALVLSEVTTPGPGLTPFACLPFSGFAELSKVLK